MLEELKRQWPELSKQEQRKIVEFVESQKADYGAEAKMLLQQLNDCAQRNYKPVPANLKLIKARLKEGHTVEDVSAVIQRKCQEWRDDSFMSQYLRPATLFGAEKFNQYVGQLSTAIPQKEKKRTRPETDAQWLELAKQVGAPKTATYNQIWAMANR